VHEDETVAPPSSGAVAPPGYPSIGEPLSQPLKHAGIDVVADATHGHVCFRLGATVAPRVKDLPEDCTSRKWENPGSVLLIRSTQDDGPSHPTVAQERPKRLGFQVRGRHPDLGQDFRNEAMDRLRCKTGAAALQAIACVMAEERFRDLAADRIVGTEKQHGRLLDDH
jgi:hypothetical protein